MKSRLLIYLLIIIMPLAGCTTRTSSVHPNFNIVMTYKSEDNCYVNGLYLRIEDVKEDYNPERDPYFLQNGQWTTNLTFASSHLVIDPGFNGSSDSRGTVRNLWDVYLEGSPHYVRPGSGIFRVAFKG